MTNFLVTGAASGLGYALVQAFSKRHPNVKIYAIDRQPSPEVFSKNSSIQYQQIDIKNEQAIRAFGEDLDKDNIGLDLVVHSAGVRGLVPSVPIKLSDDVAKAETWDVMNTETMTQAFQINALGFFVLMQALIPSLRRAVAKCANGAKGASDETFGEEEVKVVVLGSRMGSIGHNTSLGGGYAYRASKAALNAIVKSLSIDVSEVVWTVVHPGRVETGLVAIKEDGAISVEDAVAHLLSLFDKLRQEDSGRFIDRFGLTVPW